MRYFEQNGFPYVTLLSCCITLKKILIDVLLCSLNWKTWNKINCLALDKLMANTVFMMCSFSTSLDWPEDFDDVQVQLVKNTLKMWKLAEPIHRFPNKKSKNDISHSMNWYLIILCGVYCGWNFCVLPDNHLHCQHAKNSLCCQLPLVVLIALKEEHGFLTCWIKIWSQILPQTNSGIQVLTTFPQFVTNIWLLLFGNLNNFGKNQKK